MLALFIPLIILTVCNVCLIRALQQSRRLQSQCRASCRSEAGVTAAGGRGATGSGNNGQQRITPTLVALIVVFTVCVGPSGLLQKSAGQMFWIRGQIWAERSFWEVLTTNMDNIRTFWTAGKISYTAENGEKASSPTGSGTGFYTTGVID